MDGALYVNPVLGPRGQIRNGLESLIHPMIVSYREDGIMGASVIFGIGFAFPLCVATTHAADCVSRVSDGIETGNVEEAVYALKKGVDEGDERCEFILGIWSLLGNGMEQDTAVGTRWVRNAAKAGLPIAQSHLGLLYASGQGVEKDDEAAAEWYQSTAEYGDALGQAALGAVTLQGAGVRKNRVEAYMWTSLAAAQGIEKARAHLPAIERAMTADELKRAKAKVATFQPKPIPKNAGSTRARCGSPSGHKPNTRATSGSRPSSRTATTQRFSTSRSASPAPSRWGTGSVRVNPSG